MFKQALICLLVATSVAHGIFYSNDLNSCKLTKPYLNDYEPEKFGTTNNLLKNPGEYPVYCGNKIVITGRILDKNCVPVPDAKVYLWQVACDGKYPYKPLRTRIDAKKINLKNETTFTGSGTATTDNEGTFNFITIYPASLPKEGSYVNVRVEHRTLGTVQTKLFLTSGNILRKDPLLETDSSKSEKPDDAIIYDFDIVLPREGIKRY